MTKTVTFEKIVGGGKALGYIDGKPCFAAGPLPGEVAEVVIVRDRPKFLEAAVEHITLASPKRGAAAEDHYLLCSPWQNVEYDYQRDLKLLMLTDAFSRPELNVPIRGVIPAERHLGYRNKLEFSVKPGAQELELAFHARGSYQNVVGLPAGCALGSPAMNEAALELAVAAHQLKLDGYIETITVRQSQSSGEVLGHIALHQVPKRDWEQLTALKLSRVVVSRLRGRTTRELIWSYKAAELIDAVGGNQLAYAYDGFFQTNIAMFEQVLTDIIADVPRGGILVDLYGGAGTIGLAAASFVDQVVGVELDAGSSKMAAANATRNHILNFQAILSPAARLDSRHLMGARTVIVDPPRAGLEAGVVKAIMAAAPERIIYLSCNPVTQARDAQLLGVGYRNSGVTGYDLYPGTLHLESLMVFDRI